MPRFLAALLALLILAPGAQAENGTLIVLNKAEASASLIDLETLEEIGRLPTGDGPHEVAVSPDGKTAVVADYGTQVPGSTLTVIDLPSQSVTATIDLGEYHRPHGILYLADGKRVLVTAEHEQNLLLVDVESKKVERVYPTDSAVSHMVAVTPDAKRAFVANIGSGTVSVFDLDSAERVTNLETGDGAEGIDVSPNGKEVWVGNRGSNTVSIVDSQSLEILETLDCGDVPIRVKFSPNGQLVLVSNARSGDVAIFDAKSHEQKARISMEANPVDELDQRLFGDRFGDSPVPVGILVHPNGKVAYVANTNADVVTIIDLKELKIAGRFKAGQEPDGLGYTPLELKS